MSSLAKPSSPDTIKAKFRLVRIATSYQVTWEDSFSWPSLEYLSSAQNWGIFFGGKELELYNARPKPDESYITQPIMLPFSRARGKFPKKINLLI